jgi:hypothetical protein
VTPAALPRSSPLDERLLLVYPRSDTFADARVRDLPLALRAGDLVVVNDARTIPASLPKALLFSSPLASQILTWAFDLLGGLPRAASFMW